MENVKKIERKVENVGDLAKKGVFSAFAFALEFFHFINK